MLQFHCGPIERLAAGGGAFNGWSCLEYFFSYNFAGIQNYLVSMIGSVEILSSFPEETTWFWCTPSHCIIFFLCLVSSESTHLKLRHAWHAAERATVEAAWRVLQPFGWTGVYDRRWAWCQRCKPMWQYNCSRIWISSKTQALATWYIKLIQTLNLSFPRLGSLGASCVKSWGTIWYN